VLASSFGVALTTLLTSAQIHAWGWRVPYIFGLLIGPVGFYIRRHVDETPEFRDAARTRTPVLELLGAHVDRLFLSIGAVILSTSANYLILYMPTYAIRQLHLPPSSGYLATLIGGLILTFGAPVIGHWSDTVGRTRMMLASAALFAATAYPAFVLVNAHASLAVLIAVVAWLSLLKTAYSGALPALMAEIFPTRTRGTGLALSYNIAVPLFGGFAPFISASLIALSGNNLAPSFYLVITALMSFGVIVAIRRHLRLT
jgi:MHS family proline/betaine transporter-like MFS transporter